MGRMSRIGKMVVSPPSSLLGWLPQDHAMELTGTFQEGGSPVWQENYRAVSDALSLAEEQTRETGVGFEKW